jgi:thioredoxin reductase
VTRFLKTQLDKLGVDIILNSEASEKDIREASPDVVIVATGAVPYILPVPGSDQENVVHAVQILNGEVEAGDRVLVYESTGMQEGPTVADYLAEKGKQVQLLTHFPSICQHWGLKSLGNGTHLPVIWERLKRNGVIVSPYSVIKSIDGNTVTIADAVSEAESIIEGIDTVVMATGYRSENRLYKTLKEKGITACAIGDCNLPRRALDAIREGYMTAFGI